MDSNRVFDNIRKNAGIPSFDLPKGRYRLIGWDLDTSGKRLGDEIFHVAAYNTESTFSQYILPQQNLNRFVKRRYKIHVITVSNIRLLRDAKTRKLLKTKSEKSALADFIKWLEKNKGDASDGIILVYHEVKKMVPSMFLDALKRYGLFDRFAAVVKGFCNIYAVAKIKCAKTMKISSLKVLSHSLLVEEDDLMRSAAIRAKAYYTIVQRIRQNDLGLQYSESDAEADAKTETDISEFATQYSRSTSAEEQDLEELVDFLECLNSLRRIFDELMNFDWVSRMNVKRLRSKLAENRIHFNQLQCAWTNGGKISIIKLLRTLSKTTKKDFTDLVSILDSYFDPRKEPLNSEFFQRYRALKKEEEVYVKSLQNLTELC